MKKKSFAPPLTAFALTLGLLAAAAWLPAPKSQALPPPGECMGSYQTDEDWGHGVDCDFALLDLYMNLRATADATCGSNRVSCDRNLQLTALCHTGGMQPGIEVDGFMTFGCETEGGLLIP